MPNIENYNLSIVVRKNKYLMILLVIISFLYNDIPMQHEKPTFPGFYVTHLENKQGLLRSKLRMACELNSLKV